MVKLVYDKNDIVQLNDGREVRVLRLYASDTTIHKLDCVDDASASPIRFIVYPNQIVKVVKKAGVK